MCLSVMLPSSSSSSSSSGGGSGGGGENERSSSSSGGGGGDELGPSDEVKVFKDEGEDERDGNGSECLQAELLEEKSSLITESEQGKFRTGHPPFPVPNRFLDPNSPFGVSPYLVSPYAAAYANGLANTSALTRSPFLYAGDPLSSPPPAHMGAYLDKNGPAMGLRPPLYPLHHSQYAYPMLGADQLAAWHHQAASSIYQANADALRSASPYSLPITSAAGLGSPMSRFSPTGLLSHPGLSPAGLCSPVGSGLPPSSSSVSLKSERHEYSSPSSSSSNPPPPPHRNHSDKSSPNKAAKKSKEPHIKKPLNAFMLYMKEMRPVVQSECTLKESAAINQILGRRWHGLTREEQAKYYEKARMERQKHMQMYPHWNARDNYRFGLKKKKRKRDKTDDPDEQAKFYELARIERNDHLLKYPGWSARDNYAKLKKKRKRRRGESSSKLESGVGAGGMKKCRARYGLDQQELWCKPCRRKKKCIRVQAYLEGKASAGNHGLINNNHHHVRSENGKDDNNLINSDGEEDDEDDEDYDEDDGRSQPGSLESPSEPSLTSPAGFSSLPSLGSPASIASPLTPGESDWLRFNNAAAAAAAAFKPPPSVASSSSSFAAMHHHLAAVAAAAGSLQQRSPVGTDPRDSKNPLSISQLTSNPHNHHIHHHHPGGGNLPHTSTHYHHSSIIPPPPHPDKRPPLLTMT